MLTDTGCLCYDIHIQLNREIKMSQYLETSSRIQSMVVGVKSAGASCNTLVVEDSIDSITDAWRWAGKISQRQGAPTIVLSHLRSNGSSVSSGGTASGPCSFAKVFDSIASAMLRPGKKNGVTVLFLDADHPDIDEWISYGFKSQLDRAYTGVLFRPYKKYDTELLDKIAAAYDQWQVGFLCKTTIQDGIELFPNVCTEIRQVSKGQCVLGALNLSEMASLSTLEFITEFRNAAVAMAGYLNINKKNAESEPDLYTYEKQVGLGFVGMANLLGTMGVTYQAAVEWLTEELNGLNLSNTEMTPTELMERLLSTVEVGDKPGQFWLRFIGGIIAGTEAVGDKLDRLWTSQPTAHTSLRLGRDRVSTARKQLRESTDNHPAILAYMASKNWGNQIGLLTDDRAEQVMIDLGLSGTIAHIRKAVSAELQPPYAVRLPGKQGSSCIQQSQLKGSVELTYNYRIQTRDEVPYETYYKFCCLIQSVFDFTGKAHTLSHCTWTEEVTGSFVQDWLSGPLGSLYYRLDPTPAQFLDKTETWDDVDLSGMFDDEPTPGFCPLPKPGMQSDCEVCSM